MNKSIATLMKNSGTLYCYLPFNNNGKPELQKVLIDSSLTDKRNMRLVEVHYFLNLGKIFVDSIEEMPDSGRLLLPFQTGKDINIIVNLRPKLIITFSPRQVIVKESVVWRPKLMTKPNRIIINPEEWTEKILIKEPKAPTWHAHIQNQNKWEFSRYLQKNKVTMGIFYNLFNSLLKNIVRELKIKADYLPVPVKQPAKVQNLF
jgi:hypothetical protein